MAGVLFSAAHSPCNRDGVGVAAVGEVGAMQACNCGEDIASVAKANFAVVSAAGRSAAEVSEVGNLEGDSDSDSDLASPLAALSLEVFASRHC